MIKNIEIAKIHPHYDNPRKELGDLTELAESIKINGILQNLTVIPWFSQITGVGADNPVEQEKMGYIVIIGHRRLAAAKLAGLTEVPCVITNMTPQEQMATMLLENMQRNDLTVYEQAIGIQMMLDLGETVNGISEKTGFSETTIRRRTKLLELDQEKFRNSVERGATLMDYVELEKIKDIDLRNSVLEKIGTQNFKWELQRAIEKEKNEANKARIIAELEKFATMLEDNNNLQGFKYVTGFYPSDKSEVVIPDDAASAEYYFYVSEYGSIALYKKSDYSETSCPNEYEEKAKKIREKRSALEKISDQAYRLRYDFVRNISNSIAKKNIGNIIESLSFVMIDDCYGDFIDTEDYADFFNIKLVEDESDEEEADKINHNIINEYVKKQPELHLLAMTYLMLDSKGEHYHDWDNHYCDNVALDTVYDLLEKLGYRKSDEEQALCDGTHELFQE